MEVGVEALAVEGLAVEELAVEGDGVQDVSPTTTSLQSHLELLGSCPASDDASSLPVSRAPDPSGVVTPPQNWERSRAVAGEKRPRGTAGGDPMDLSPVSDSCAAKRVAPCEEDALLCLPLQLEGDHLTPHQLAREIARCLHEPKQMLVRDVVDVLGEERSIELFTMTAETQRHGGTLTADGDKKRAPGGVFFSLVRSCASEDQKKQIFHREKKNKKKRVDKAVEMSERQRKRRTEERKMQQVLEGSKRELEQMRAELTEQEEGEGEQREHPPDRNMEKRWRKREEYTDLDDPVDQEDGAKLDEGWRNELEDDGCDDFASQLRVYEQLKQRESQEEGEEGEEGEDGDGEGEKGEEGDGEGEEGVRVSLEEKAAVDQFERTSACEVGFDIDF